MKKILDPLAVVAFAAALMLSGLFIGPAIATQPNKWLYPNLVVPNNGTFGGTVTAAAFSGPLTATTGSYSSTLDVVGQATFGAATTKSTFTTTGNLATGAGAFTGALTGTSAAFSTTLDAAGQSTFGAASTKSTFTSTGNLATGAAALSGALTGTSAAFSSTLDAAGQTTFGAAATKSTFTTAGAFASYTSITAGTSVTATTSVNATTALAVTAGPLKLYVRTLAQLQAITPAAGDVYLCSNCAIPYQIAVGTGAVINGFMQASDGAGLQ